MTLAKMSKGPRHQRSFRDAVQQRVISLGSLSDFASSFSLFLGYRVFVNRDGRDPRDGIRLASESTPWGSAGIDVPWIHRSVVISANASHRIAPRRTGSDRSPFVVSEAPIEK